jgi:hypothetical protein
MVLLFVKYHVHYMLIEFKGVVCCVPGMENIGKGMKG